jgi:nucleoside-diphosphate-sugar epimerase
MKVLILGVDGYIGWPLAQYLKAKGHEVVGVDNLLKAKIAAEDGSRSCIPQLDLDEKSKHLGISIERFDVGNFMVLGAYLEESSKPDVVVNLAQIASAPYSMRDHATCLLTQENNNRTNLATLWMLNQKCSEVPMIVIGSMGEYGTPNVDIPEGDFELEFRGRKDRCQFPRKPASLYHSAKVASSANCEFACRTWDLSITDIMQGVVYGTWAPGVESPPAFYVDSAHGTALNRFCAQAVAGHPLTVYGTGKQRRGFLPLQDSLRCIELLCENPPEPGEYRVVNQFDQAYSILELAQAVQEITSTYEELEVPEIQFLNNPRIEADEHYYNPDRSKLVELGYEPQGNLAIVINEMLSDLLPHRERIDELAHLMMPRDLW